MREQSLPPLAPGPCGAAGPPGADADSAPFQIAPDVPMHSFFGEQGRQVLGGRWRRRKTTPTVSQETQKSCCIFYLQTPPPCPGLPAPNAQPSHPSPGPAAPARIPPPPPPLRPPSSPLSPCHQIPVPPDQEAELLCLPSSSQAGRSGLVMNPSGQRNPPSAGRSLGREHTRSARAVLGNTVTRGCARCLTNPDSVSHRAVSASHCRLLRGGAGPSLNIPKFNLFEHSVFAVQRRKSKSNELRLGKYR